MIPRLKNSEPPQDHHSPSLHNLLTLPSEGVGTGIGVFLRNLGKSWTWVTIEIFQLAMGKKLKCISVFLSLLWTTCAPVIMHSECHFE